MAVPAADTAPHTRGRRPTLTLTLSLALALALALTLTLALILNQVDLWSAVFYVSEGEPNAPGFPSPLGGHMVLRALTNP